MDTQSKVEGSFDLPDVLKILYQALMQSIEDPFRILDREYRLLWINRPEPCQEVGKVCYENIYGLAGPCPTCAVTTAFATGKPAKFDKQGVYPDGSEMWREVRAYPVFDSGSNAVYCITIGHDYGEEKMDAIQQRKRIETLQNTLYKVAQSNLEPSEIRDERPVTDLSRRELQVLRLMAQGLTNASISGILSISPHTVKTHVIRIFNKLGVSDRTQAATLATRLNLI